jgi:hypothetical protein
MKEFIPLVSTQVAVDRHALQAPFEIFDDLAGLEHHLSWHASPRALEVDRQVLQFYN